MKKLLSVLFSSVMFMSVFSLMGCASKSEEEVLLPDQEYIEGEIIVGFKKEKDNKSTSLMKIDDEDIEIAVVKIGDQPVEEAIKEYSKKSNVAFAEPNYVISSLSTSPDFTGYEYYPTDKEGGIDVPNWNDASHKTSEEIVVAIIDSGVDYLHEDLKDVMWTSGLNYPTLVEMGGGKHGFNAAAYVNSEAGDTSDPMPPKAEGAFHGTHVAGIIAASWNGYGTSGITNGAKIMAIRTGDKDGAITMEAIVAAFDYLCKAYDAGVNVVVTNNSWGGSYTSYASLLAIKEAAKRGIIVVFATGNDGKNMDKSDSVIYMLKDYPNVILVNASDSSERHANFSNYGIFTTDIYAPGTEIVATFPRDNLYANPDYSTPIVLNDFDSDSPLKIYEKTNEIDATYQKSNKEGYLGTNCYKVSDDSISTIECTEDLSSSKPKYLTFMAEKDRIYNKVSFTLSVKTKSGDIVRIADSGIVEDNKWMAVSFALPENINYEFLEADLMATYVFHKKIDESMPEVRIDNLMLTNEAWPYYKLSGTSMAAPVVTGEVASIYGAFKNDEPLKIVARTLGSAKKIDTLEDKCVTGGIANLRNALEEKYAPVIFDADFEEGQLKINGEFFLESGSLYINDIYTPTTSWSNNLITANMENVHLFTRFAKIEVRNNNIEGFNSGLRYVPLESRSTGFKEIEIPNNDNTQKLALNNVAATSLGNSIYFMTADEAHSVFYITEYNTYTDTWFEVTHGLECPFITSQIVAYQGKIMTIMGKKDGDKYAGQMFIYDPDTKLISYVEIDHLGSYAESALVNYHGDLLIVGGGQIKDFQDFQKNYDVLKIDLDNKKLVKLYTFPEDQIVPDACVVSHDMFGRVFLGFQHHTTIIYELEKKEDGSFVLNSIGNANPPSMLDPTDETFQAYYAQAYSVDGIIVTGADLFTNFDEVISDTYVGVITLDGNMKYTDTGLVFSSTYYINPVAVVNGDNYYVLASCSGSGELGKTLRYLEGYKELVPKGTLAPVKPNIPVTVILTVVGASTFVALIAMLIVISRKPIKEEK